MKSYPSNRYKVLVLSHISDLVGGAEMSMVNVFDHWAQKYGVQPEFIMRKPAGTLASAFHERGWKYHTVDYTFWSDGIPPSTHEQIYRNGLKNTKAIREIEKIIKISKPDLVVTNSVVSPWAAVAAYFQGVPHVWFVREYGDLDHGRVFEIGREKTFEDVDTMSELVVANSKTLEKHLSQYIDPKKLTTLYTPLNIQELEEKAAERVASPYKNKDSLKLVITGNLAATKGQLEAIQAVGRLNAEGFDTELCMIGGRASKEFTQVLENEIQKFDLSGKVHLVGFQKNPLAYVALADVGIMASRQEAFGRVTFEYLAAGKPVVGSDSGATPEMVIAGKNGYLFKAGSSDSLFNGLKHYAVDRDSVPEHGKASRERALKMMESEYNVDALYKKVANIPGKKPKTQLQKPLNLSHRWLEYLQVADNYIKSSGTVSVKRLIASRIKTRMKRSLRTTKQIARRILGK